MNLDDKIKHIKMLLLDVDGVMTDGSIIFSNNGEALKVFNAQDGFGIRMAQRCGIKVGIITGRTSDIVSKRAQELKLDEVYQGHYDKDKAYKQILATNRLQDHEVAYIGDDLFDLPVLTQVGFSIAVANAREEVKQRADYVTSASGGKGAVREVIDLILKAQNKWTDVLTKMGNDDGKRMHQ